MSSHFILRAFHFILRAPQFILRASYVILGNYTLTILPSHFILGNYQITIMPSHFILGNYQLTIMPSHFSVDNYALTIMPSCTLIIPICRKKFHPCTLKLNPLRSNDLQAHWARAKRQQHLPKELAIYLNLQQYQSVISGKTRDVTWITPKLCGAGAPNTGQYTMPAEYQRFSRLIIYWLRINVMGLSLSLPALRLPSAR